jgi:hypothetical protein
MGAGKSATASILQDMGYQRLAFADILREVLSPIYGALAKDENYFVHSADGTETGPLKQGREILQEMGAAMRSVDSGVFVRAMARKLYELGATRVVVDDVRFPNEANVLVDKGFQVFKLVCPSPIRRERVGKGWIGENDISELSVRTITAPEINTANIKPLQVAEEIAKWNRMR